MKTLYSLIIILSFFDLNSQSFCQESEDDFTLTLPKVLNINFRLLNSTSQEWNDTIWSNNSNVSYTLTPSGYIETAEFSIWNKVSGEWEKRSKNILLYDEFNRLSDYTQYTWNDSLYIPKIKQVLTYTGFDSLYESTTYLWSDSNGIWDNYNKVIHIYNSYNYLTEKTYFKGNGIEWDIHSKNNYSYNENNQLIEDVFYQLLSNWSNIHRFLYDYENGKILSCTSQTWENDSWLNSEKETYSYNGDNIVEEIKCTWYNEWKNTTKTNWEYNSNNEVQICYGYYWMNNVWNESSMLEYKYDYDNNLSELLTYIKREGIWINRYRNLYEYMRISGAEKNISVSEFRLSEAYPNPFNPGTKISFSVPFRTNLSLAVYDMLGNKIATLINEEKNRGEYTIAFDGRNLASGIYFYNLTAGNYSSTKKMIILK